MKKQIETIQKMSETLESSGFTRDQSVAVVSSIALAMKNFAVTPELLDERLAKQSREWNQRFDEHKREMNRRFDEHKAEINQRFDGVDKRFDGVDKRLAEHKAETNQRFDAVDKRLDQTQQLLRNNTRSVLALALVILAGALGLVGVMLDA